MSGPKTMDDYTSDFRSIFDEVSEEQLRKDPRLIVPYLRDLNVDPILIRMIETTVMYSKTDFLASVTCPVEKVQDTVEKMASRIYADRDSLFQLINMMRDARGVGVVAVQPMVAKAAPVSTTAPGKTETKTTVKPVVKTVACKDPETGRDVMKAEDGSAYYSMDLKELIRCDKNATVLVMPDSVEKISYGAFRGCFKLNEIYYSNSLNSIKGNYDDCCLLRTIHIPDSVMKIEEYCFSGCPSLKDVKLPSSLMMIESGAFDNCKSLTDISIPASVIVVREYAFNECNSLRSITLEGTNTTLEEAAILSCKNLEHLYIPRGSSLTEDCVCDCDKCIIERV